jgi:hypothetical protein
MTGSLTPLHVSCNPLLSAVSAGQVTCLGLADTARWCGKASSCDRWALRLDASRGRWVVTELRWWRNETDTATTPARDGGSS